MWQVGQKSSEEGADADTCTLSELLSAPAPGAGAHLQGITCFFASSDRGGRTQTSDKQDAWQVFALPAHLGWLSLH